MPITELATIKDYTDFISGSSSTIFYVLDIVKGRAYALDYAESKEHTSVRVGIIDRSKECFRCNYDGQPEKAHLFQVYYQNSQRLDQLPMNHEIYRPDPSRPLEPTDVLTFFAEFSDVEMTTSNMTLIDYNSQSEYRLFVRNYLQVKLEEPKYSVLTLGTVGKEREQLTGSSLDHPRSLL